MRMIPQILRLYIQYNNQNRIDIADFVTLKNYSPLLIKYYDFIKRNKKATLKEITFYKNELKNGEFKFRTQSEDGISASEEDLAHSIWDSSDLIKTLNKLEKFIEAIVENNED